MSKTQNGVRWEEPVVKKRLSIKNSKKDNKYNQQNLLKKWHKGDTELNIRCIDIVFRRVKIIDIDTYTVTVADLKGLVSLIYKNSIQSISELSAQEIEVMERG